MAIMRIFPRHRRVSLPGRSLRRSLGLRLITPAKPQAWRFALLLGLLWVNVVVVRAGPVHYVAHGGQPATPNYESWDTAASNIEDAIGAAVAPDTVLVSNGTYNLTNQIIITANITVRSFKGADITIVNGDNYTGKPVTNRCFYMNTGSVLDGFTISNGLIVTYGDLGGGGVYLNSGATVQNCTITGNLAVDTAHGGGGVYFRAGGTVDNCTLSGNTVSNKAGGGAYFYNSGTLNNCTITGNTVVGSGTYGGGVCTESGGMISNCTFANNTSYRGAGATLSYGGTMINCLVKGNTAGDSGGVWLQNGGGTLNNCLIIGNSGGVGYCFGVHFAGGGTMNNCTVSGNIGNLVVNAAGVTLNNCIIWGSAWNWWALMAATVSYTCADTVQSGPGNIAFDPLFANTNIGNYRLTANSPCVNTGTNGSWTTGAVDRDEHRRIDVFSGHVDMGCYEYIPNGTLFRIP